jgi:hypothetical protein
MLSDIADQECKNYRLWIGGKIGLDLNVAL